jgi:hypothetical protein
MRPSCESVAGIFRSSGRVRPSGNALGIRWRPVSVNPRSIKRVSEVVAAFICTAGLVSGCSTAPSSPPSKSAPLPTGTGTSSQQTALLTASEVSAIQGAPTGVEVVPSQKGTLFQDPDPRGPCGAKVILPDLSQSAHVTFDAASFGAFQVVVDQPVSMATAFATAWQRDTRAGCPPYTSRTNSGSTQISELLDLIPMPSLVDQAAGAFITVNSGQTVDTYAMVLRSGGRLELDVLISPGSLAEAFVVGFAQAAESKLKRSLRSSS